MTIAEIAAAGLPGLPASARGIDKRARAEGWAQRPGLSRPRKGKRGGGLEYSIEILPEEARRALIAAAGPVVIQPEIVAALQLREADPLSGAERERRDARLHVLATFETFRRDKALAIRDARVLFADLWNAGEISAPGWVRDIVPSLSKWSLDNWRAVHRDQGPDALGIDRRGRPAAISGAGDGQVELATLGAIAKNEFLSGDDLADWLREHHQITLTTRSVQRTRRRLEDRHRNVLMKLRDPDGYRSKVKVSATNSTFSAGLNDLWQIDASPADVMLKGARRHSIYLAIDIWSRRTMVLVTSSARALAVAALMRKCLLAWGVPNRVQTDQGSDFTAKATSRLMEALRIEHDICDAFDPARKGNVERAIKTFQHDLAVCPGFIGHNVAMRKKIESRKAFSRRLGMPEEELFDVDLDLVEFQGWCDQWAETIYAHSDHAALRGGASTPFLKAASWSGEIRKISVPTALDVLLAPVAGKDGIRRITKQGIKIAEEYYQTAAGQPGEDVLVRMDPMDLGRAMVFALDGETWLGEAICPPLAGLDPVEVTMKVKAAQKAHEQGMLSDIRKEMRKIGPRDFMAATLSQARQRAASVIAFERPATPYSTPALEAAQEAVRASQPEVSAYTPEQAARAAAAVVSMPKARPAPKTTPEQRFRRALDIEARIERGEQIDTDDEVFIRGYRPSSEYRGWMRVFEKQGEAIFAR